MFEILMQYLLGSMFLWLIDLQLLGSGYFSFLALKHGSHLATLPFLKTLHNCPNGYTNFFTLFVMIKSLYLSPD